MIDAQCAGVMVDSESRFGSVCTAVQHLSYISSRISRASFSSAALSAAVLRD